MIVIEDLARLCNLVCVEIRWITTDVDARHLRWLDHIHHELLGESEIVAKADFTVLEELEHLLLCQWGEQEPELHLVVAIGCTEQGIELGIRHDREALTVLEVARLCFELLYGAAFAPVVDHSVFEPGKIGGCPGEGEVGGRLASIYDSSPVAILGIRLVDRGIQGLMTVTLVQRPSAPRTLSVHDICREP